MFRLLLVAALIGHTMTLPIQDAKIFFPGEDIPIDPRGGYSQHSGQAEQRTYYTKSSSRKGGGYQSPISWPQAVGENEPSYGQPGHHAYSSYGQHPRHYSSHSYGTGGAERQSYPHTAHSYQSYSYSHSGGHTHNSNGGSVEGQIEQVSHGSYGAGSSGGLDGSRNDGTNWQGTGHHDNQHHKVVETSYGSHHTDGGIAQILGNGRVEETGRPKEEARRPEEEARGHEEEARRQEEEARRHEEEARRHEEEARRPEEEARRHEEEARRQEEESRRQEEEARRHEEEARRPEEEARRYEEEARRPEEEARRHEEEARRHEEEARRHEEEARRPLEESPYAQHTEGQVEHVSDTRPIDDGGRPIVETSFGQHAVGNEREAKIEEGKKPVDADIAAEEHRIVQELEQLVGMKSQPEESLTSTKNPITQTQEILREMNGWSDPNHKASAKGKKDNRQDFGGPAVESGSSHPPVRHHDHTPEEHPVYQREEAVESPMTYHGNHVIQAQVRDESHNQKTSHKKSTPDPLDLMNLYNEYNHGDFQPGHGKQATVEPPKKELKPEIKQAIDNIMRDWEVLPDREGKPQPPPRKYKITKHVKVTTTTHNHPAVVHPSQTITKTVRTHTYEPSASHHRQVITHHINIAELLEQLRQLETSPHHRNVTWCEEKIKEFLTELNRKEESGIEINQSVQEETLHHILTQDQTITKEIHHEVGHDSSGGVEEEPFVKKTVVELGQNEPTKPPSYGTEQETEHETHFIGNNTSSSLDEKEHRDHEPHEIIYETSKESHTAIDESQVVTVTPSPHNVPPLEALSHQSHTSSETVPESNENHLITENEGDMDHQGSEPEGVTTAPVEPIPERPGKSDTEEFRGETERQERPLPPDYKPRDTSEETKEIESGHVVEPKEHRPIDDLSIELPENVFSHEEGKLEHESNNNVPAYAEGKSNSKEETKTFIENEQENTHTHEVEIEHQNPGHYHGGHVVNTEEGSEGSSHQGEEKIIHELNTGEHSVGNTEYVVESEHSSSGEKSRETSANRTEEILEHSQGREGGNRTEYVEETVEHSGGNHGHSGGSVNTEYVEETVHHSSGGGGHDHSSGGSQTEYVEETVEHHNSEGNHEINYDQLIEELISLESLPGHQAIDKCEEKIRHFLEVLRRQQERGFDQNKAELQRLRLLLEEIQAQKQNQHENSANPQSTESSNSFWKKIGRKIKTTFEKAKTKAHDTVNNMMN